VFLSFCACGPGASCIAPGSGLTRRSFASRRPRNFRRREPDTEADNENYEAYVEQEDTTEQESYIEE